MEKPPFPDKDPYTPSFYLVINIKQNNGIFKTPVQLFQSIFTDYQIYTCSVDKPNRQKIQ